MRLESIHIAHYRSIDQIELIMPLKKPLVLFGPNNAGKSNILSAINRIIGERYPSYIEMLESDYYFRDKEKYPESNISATFDSPICNKFSKDIKTIAIRYGSNGNPNENLLHDGMGNKIYPSNEERAKCQSFLIDADRSIQNAFNYSSQYSLLSKFSHKIHSALSAEHKEELSGVFEQIKSSFENTHEFIDFFSAFSDALKGSVKGFVHSLDVDFSAYDPNNYAKSLRIYAKEGTNIRGFEEFGTGEQQVLLMAFVKAYMQVFSSENFVLIIEEPEAHLHPLAQKWLKEYIIELCSSGIQVIISTHSTDFIDAEYLDGLVRVYKTEGVTRVKQLSCSELCKFCIESGAPEDKTFSSNISDYYATKLFPDQLKGVFAETILLVEGETEFFALPVYLKNTGFSLAEYGIEIVNCRGKNNIPLFWRLFTAYGYNCYPIFDGDCKTTENDKIFDGLISCDTWITDEESFFVGNKFAYFGKDFESYFRLSIKEYHELEEMIVSLFQINTKPGRAKAVARRITNPPPFVEQLKSKLKTIRTF